MYVVPEKKLIFFANPRTASQAVRDYLEENYEVERATSNPMWPPGWGDHHSVDFPRLEQLVKKGYKGFCVVRNPWDWFVSMWKFAALPDVTFADYMENFQTGPKSWNLFLLQEDALLYGGRYGIIRHPRHIFWVFPQLSEYVLKFETLQAELSDLLGTQVDLPVVGSTERGTYQGYYSNYYRDWVQMTYGVEIKKYNYTFEQRGQDNAENSHGRIDQHPETVHEG